MADIFLKLGSKIKGESTDDGHPDWCEAMSITLRFGQPVSEQGGTGGRSAAGVWFDDFQFEKTIDTATTDILAHCCSGEHIPMVEVECSQSALDKNVYLRYEFENCMISEVDLNGGVDEKPTEIVKINFGSVKLFYTPIDKEGTPGTTADRGWSLETNTKL